MSDSNNSDCKWVEKINIGSVVEGEIQEIKEFGVVLSFKEHNDVVGFIAHHQSKYFFLPSFYGFSPPFVASFNKTIFFIVTVFKKKGGLLVCDLVHECLIQTFCWAHLWSDQPLQVHTTCPLELGKKL